METVSERKRGKRDTVSERKRMGGEGQRGKRGEGKIQTNKKRREELNSRFQTTREKDDAKHVYDIGINVE